MHRFPCTVAIPTHVSIVEHTIAVYCHYSTCPETSIIPLPVQWDCVRSDSALSLRISVQVDRCHCKLQLPGWDRLYPQDRYLCGYVGNTTTELDLTSTSRLSAFSQIRNILDSSWGLETVNTIKKAHSTHSTHTHTHNSHWFHQGAPLHNLTGNTILLLYTSALGQ